MHIILMGLQKAGKALHADAHSYFFAALAVLAADMFHLPGEYIPVLAVAVVVWIVLCIFSHIPLRDEEKAAMVQQLLDEKQFNENVIIERDTALKDATDIKRRMDKLQADFEVQIGNLASMLCTQFYLRITERLRAEGFSGTSWDFLTPHPNEALTAGKEVRIKLTDADEYQTADVQFHPHSGVLSMRISKPVADVPQAPVEKVREIVQSSARKVDDGVLEDWLRQNASAVEDAGFEANKKGLTSYIYSKNLPGDKALWPRLGALLEQDEFYEHVEMTNDGLRIQIKNWGAQAVG